MLPLLGRQTFSAIGLPNSSSQGRFWPGLEPGSSSEFGAVLNVRALQHDEFERYVLTTRLSELPETVTVEENGEAPPLMCLHAVLEEEFEHLRYMIRDLSTLGVC